jgi:hypothetical protein
MNAIKFLEQQHREVEALFAKIEKTSASKDRKDIFNEIALRMEIHAKLEEKLFYPEGREVDKDMTLEAYEEHDVVKALIRKCAKTRPNAEEFMARVTVLKEVIEHHVKEEEETYFPECEKAFGAEKLEELGEEMVTAFERLVSPKMKSRSKKRPQKKAA